MVAPALGEAKLKDALKSALVELLEERSDLLREVLADVFEDVALARAIREGEASEPTSREEIFRFLDSAE